MSYLRERANQSCANVLNMNVSYRLGRGGALPVRAAIVEVNLSGFRDGGDLVELYQLV